MLGIKERIQELKEKENAVILAHYYVSNEVQEIADYIGDSYYLSKLATTLEERTIVLCGVSFMGESAKILNPSKRVLMPEIKADCPMAYMADVNLIEKMRKEYKDLAVVCYVNSTADLKMHSDVCVTSSNAVKIVKELPNKNIFFIPDENLGSYVKDKVPEKNIILNKGFCYVHKAITTKSVIEAKKVRPNAKVLVHPECIKDVTVLADYVGSTGGMIDYVKNSSGKEFIICTEEGLLCKLKKENPDKEFYLVEVAKCCASMKKITPEKIYNVLESKEGEIKLSDEIINKAIVPLRRMLELSR